MEKTNLLTLVVTLTVGIILAGSLLMPVITDATTTEKTFVNDGYFTLDKLDSSATETIIWTYTEPTKLTIGTEKVDLPVGDGIPTAFTLIANEDFFFRWVYSNSGSYVQLYKTDNASAYRAREVDSATMTITIGSGSITFNNGSNPQEISYTNLYCISPAKGAFVMKNMADSAYLLEDSEVFAYGGSYVTSVTFYTIIEGTPEDEFTRIVWPDDAHITYDDLANDLTQVDGYLELFTLKQFTYNTVNTDTSATGSVTYSYFIVPTSVTAELEHHLDAGEIALINALPILVIIGLVLAGVGAIFVRNRD